MEQPITKIYPGGDREAAERKLRMLVDAIGRHRSSHYQKRAAPTRQALPRLSGVRRCAREMVHQTISWDKRPKWDQWQLERFQRGHDIEELAMVPELMRLGFKVIHGQMTLELKSRDRKRTIATGHIDGEIEYEFPTTTEGVTESVNALFDAKSMHPILWNKIPADPDGWAMDGMQYMMRDKYAYSYVWQILAYMWAKQRDTGLFIIDDLGGHWKFIPVVLWDWLDEIDKVLDRLELVADSIEVGEMPPYFDDATYCRDCWCFQSGVCQPPMSFKDAGLTILNNQNVSDALTRMDEIRSEGTEFNRLDKAMKDTMKTAGTGRFMVGNHVVEVTEYQTSRVVVPAELKKAYTVKGVGKRIGVKRIAEPEK